MDRGPTSHCSWAISSRRTLSCLLKGTLLFFPGRISTLREGDSGPDLSVYNWKSLALPDRLTSTRTSPQPIRERDTDHNSLRESPQTYLHHSTQVFTGKQLRPVRPIPTAWHRTTLTCCQRQKHSLIHYLTCMTKDVFSASRNLNWPSSFSPVLRSFTSDTRSKNSSP